jgi:hypothetical protein
VAITTNTKVLSQNNYGIKNIMYLCTTNMPLSLGGRYMRRLEHAYQISRSIVAFVRHNLIIIIAISITIGGMALQPMWVKSTNFKLKPTTTTF